MAKKYAASDELTGPQKQRAYWIDELNKAKKRYRTFNEDGDRTVDQYRLEKSDGNPLSNKDKFNILYSSTETIRPNLYSQAPIPRVRARFKDSEDQPTKDAVMLLERCLGYVSQEENLDEILEQVVEDYLLPGMACAWVTYEAQFKESEAEEAELLDEQVRLHYVYWQDFLTGVTRGWKQVPWVGRRIHATKELAEKRFGKEKAAQLAYNFRSKSSSYDQDNSEQEAEIWEIWCKSSKKVYWVCESYKDGLLDEKEDPLKLKGFFPCPKPLRAIYNTRSFVPKSFYSQYKDQADTLNVLTRRIRLLGEALRVVGVYNGSETKLSDLLSPNGGNKMIPVDNWAAFAQDGGIANQISWLPIEQVANVLRELLSAREVAKAEIYEVTGFSDIVRGASKASETLGAQQIKQNWAGARVKKMQKEVQRFARDVLAIAGEIMSEHCDPATLALFGGVKIPTGDAVEADPNAQAALQRFTAAYEILKTEKMRAAMVDIETDSTLLADEEIDRKDRMDFLGAAGAFLQQAVPAMEATPELGPLLGAMLMFTVRTFPASRVIEEEFEKIQQAMANRAPKSADNGEAAKAQVEQQKAQIAAQTEQARLQQEGQLAQAEIQAKQQADAQKGQLDSMAEQNRHTEKLAELELKAREVSIKEQELALKQAELELKRAELGIKQQAADTAEMAATRAADTAEVAAQHSMEMAEAGHEQENERMDREDQRAAQEPKKDD